MGLEAISEEAVKQALRAIRYGQPLGTSPLLALDVLSIRLRSEGIADNERTRAWLLGQWLEEMVRHQIALLRQQLDRPLDERTVGDLAVVRADYQTGNEELQAWSLVWYRYFAADPPRLEDLADQLGIAYRTLARRLELGHRLLAQLVLEAEANATAELRAAPLPLRERLIVQSGAAAESVDGIVAAVLTAIDDPSRLVHIAPEMAQAVARSRVTDFTTYRVARVVEWSLPQHRLCERYVTLTLLVDRGPNALGERWLPSERRFSGLEPLLAALPDPAVVILGPPGSGKSTLLRRLELDVSSAALQGEERPLTFLVSLGGYGAEEAAAVLSPLEWLERRWSAMYPCLPRLADCLAAGAMWLLLDGLNEIPHCDVADRHRRLAAWKRFLVEDMPAYPLTRAIFTCRNLEYSAPLSAPDRPVPQVRVEPLSDEQVRDFLRRHAPPLADALWETLHGSSQLELLRTPFFLKLFVDQAAELGTPPSGHAELFARFVRAALGREVERGNALFAPDELLTERDHLRLQRVHTWRGCDLPEQGRLLPCLARLAYQMQAHQPTTEMTQRRIAYDAALTVLAERRAADILRAGVALGVLDEDLDAEEVFFAHQLLQEFFAARWLMRCSSSLPGFVPWRKDEVRPDLAATLATLAPHEPLPPLPATGWEETLLLAGAMSDEPDAWLAQLAKLNLPLAGKCATLPGVAERLSSQRLEWLRQELIERSRDRDADLRARIAAGEALGQLGDPRFPRLRGPQGEYLVPPLVVIPAGIYPIGEDEPIYHRGQKLVDHMPRHTVPLASFALAAFPVTNAEWACFMAAGGYEDERWWDTAAGRAWRAGHNTAGAIRAGVRHWLTTFRSHPERLESMFASGELTAEAYQRWHERLAMSEADFEAHLQALYPDGRLTEPRLWRDQVLNQPSQPVVGITWYEARAYCRWLSAQTGRAYRLPTEVEWEAAARGPEGRRYPGGDTFGPESGNTVESHVRRPTPVGVFPDGDTPEGVADMAGNVNEWTSSAWGRDPTSASYTYPYDPNDGREDPEQGPEVRRVLRGGSWNDERARARSAMRIRGRPDGWDYGDGFRLATSDV